MSAKPEALKLLAVIEEGLNFAENEIARLKAECERLRHALEIVAAQHSGKACSTKLSDCMATIAKAALNA